MKLSLFSNVLLASMLVFAASCGKDSKKSHNDNLYGYYNPYIAGQAPSAQGQTAINNLTAYINGVETNSSLVGAVNVVKSVYSCKTKDLLGISFLPLNYCSTSQSSAYKYATPGQTRLSMNPELGTLLTPPAGYTLGNVVQYGTAYASVIQVEHYMNSGSGIDTVQYTVELNRHAIVNPTIKKDTAAQRIEQVVSPQI
ncbi:MAG: hypothetical protein ACJ76H_07275 [Bacteriovoracaceae bacterium]